MASTPRVVFMGTPDYAVPALDTVLRRGAVVAVTTRPDARQGRGRHYRPSPVAIAAARANLPIWKPAVLDEAFVTEVEAFRPDVIITAAYGLILPERLLRVPRNGCFNLHASLLPRWRGANPIAWAIRAGDTETGVSLMRMDAGMDTGPIVGQAVTAIEGDATTGQLTAVLSDVAARLLDTLWDEVMRGAVGVPQGRGATKARRFRPEEAQFNPDATAVEAWCWWRSMRPDPGPYIIVGGYRLGLEAVRVREEPGPVGQIAVEGEYWRIGCRTGSLLVVQVRPAGGRPMTPEAFRRGHPGLPATIG